jgi:hypothetical protein
MSTTVVVPARDYVVPVEKTREYVGITGPSGYLLTDGTDRLITDGTSLLLIRGGSEIRAPYVVVPFRDYTIVVPERLTNG